MKRWISLVILTIPLFFLLGAAKLRPVASKHSPLSPVSIQFHSGYALLPLAFEPNVGQVDPQVKFLARGQGYSLFLTAREAVLSLKKSGSRSPRIQQTLTRSRVSSHPTPDNSPPTVLRLKLLNAQENATFESSDKLSGISNYFIGKDPAQWHRNIPQYAKIQAHEIYPGVDMVYYGNQGKLEYDFRLKPGADHRVIRMKLDGAGHLEIDPAGKLKITADGRLISFLAPVAYQEEADGSRTAVEGKYLLTGDNEIGFEMDPYDKTKPLVIDPALDYSTYVGGTTLDECNAIAVDASGNAYITGYTQSTDFPTTAGAYQTTFVSLQDAFVTKLNNSGTALIYSTFLQGTNLGTQGIGIAVDSSGDAYVTGTTSSGGFPTTAGAYQTALNGTQNAFLTKLSPGGSSLLYSTLLGGNNAVEGDQGNAIALDNSGNAYITGYTGSSNFPTTNPAYQMASPDAGYPHAFVSKINPEGNGNADLAASTYLGGDITVTTNSTGEQGMGIAVDSSGNIYVDGFTGAINFPTTTGAFQTTVTNSGYNHAFVSKISNNAVTLLYSSYLDGNMYEECQAIALDANQNVYLTGYSYSSNFPITGGAYQTVIGPSDDIFIAKMKLAGNGNADLLYSTFLGGSGANQGSAIALDGNDNIYVTGWTTSGDFPTTAGAYLTVFGGSAAPFLSELNPGGNGARDLLYSTFFGSNATNYGKGIALDNSGNVYLAGYADGGIATTAGAFQTADPSFVNNAFVAKFDVAAFNTPTATVTNTPTPSPTGTNTPSSTPTATPVFTHTATNTPATQTITSTPSSTPTRTLTPAPTATATVTLTPTASSMSGGCVGMPITCYSYPNPATGGTMSLMCELCETSTVVVTVYNVAAERVATYNYTGSNGSNVYSLDILGFAHGVYFLIVHSSGPSGSRQSNVEKFAIVR